MRKKQWIWLIVAVCVFTAAGISSVVANTWSRLRLADTVDMFGGVLAGVSEAAFPAEDFVAVVDIEGTITRQSGGSLLSAATGYDQDYLLDYIDRLMECGSNVGILLNIDSGGGEIGASDDMYLKLMDYKEATGRPVYAYFGDYACSGAYYIAMAADEIWANRNSICVNIGVYIGTYNLSELFEKYGIKEIMIKSSENKGIGSTGTPWTEEQLAIYQSIVDLYYDQFLEVVADGRGMTKAQVRRLDDGREMLATQALDAGFVDGIGRYEEYEQQVLGYFDGDVLMYKEEPEESSLGLLAGFFGKLAGTGSRSELEILQGLMERDGGIVVMAYAG